MKQAYLIIAHNEPDVFKTLIELLDYPEHDIFVHIDKKSDIRLFNTVKPIHSNIYFLEQRNDVRWGHVSQLKTELELFEYAHDTGSYSCYHLLSGVDLPTKKAEYIYTFFDNNQDKEFFDFWTTEYNVNDMTHKTSYYFLLMKHYKSTNFFICKTRSLFVHIQKWVHFRRKYDMELKKGSNWISCSNDFVEYVISRKTELLKQFNFTLCCDEIAIHSVIWNSPFKKNLYVDKNGSYSAMRMIDWKRGNPYTWKDEDVDFLLKSDSLFTRKISSSDVDLSRYKEELNSLPASSCPSTPS